MTQHPYIKATYDSPQLHHPSSPDPRVGYRMPKGGRQNALTPNEFTGLWKSTIYYTQLTGLARPDYDASISFGLPFSPNPPKDTDGRREDRRRGMRELQGRWPGLDRGRWEVGGGSSVTAQAPNGRLRELGCAGWQ